MSLSTQEINRQDDPEPKPEPEEVIKVDNGPITPGGVGMELPPVQLPDSARDILSGTNDPLYRETESASKK